MWTIPQEAAGEIGKKFIAVNEYPTPTIGMRDNPKIPIAKNMKYTFPTQRAEIVIKRPNVEVSMIKLS